MKPVHSEYDDDTRDDELSGTLLAAVEAASHRQTDTTTINRVIERASQFALASPSGGPSVNGAESRSTRHALPSRKPFAFFAAWSGVAAAVVCLAVGWLLIPQNPSAFAQVQEQLAKVRTIQFVIRSTDPAGQQLGRVFVVQPDRYREELADGRVVVADLQMKQVMELNSKTMTGESYSLYDATDRERRIADAISILLDAPGNSVETLGRRQLEGRDVIDYRIVERDRAALKVTVDGATKLPVRIEVSDAAYATTWIDFVFDQPIDEALVRIAAPEGFAVTQIKPAARPDADELVVSSAGLGPVKWGMKTADVVKLLGQPDGIKPFETPININGKVNPTRKRSGEELIYDSRGLRIIVDARTGVEFINCYGAGQLGDRARAFTGRTDKGIRMRATPDEVRKAYGEPDRRAGMTAELPNGKWDYLKDGLSFGFFDNRLSHIQLLGPQLRPNAQGILVIPRGRSP